MKRGESGHKTRAVFERYNIVSPQDLLDAAAKIDSYHRRRVEDDPAHNGHKNGHTL